MRAPETLETERLILRRWRADDFAPFAALNADPQVMEHFPAAMTADETRAMIARLETHFDDHGFGAWALEEKVSGRFIGFTGLGRPRFTTHFTPCVEVGWRLARDRWGHGLAYEAARAAIDHGFTELGLEQIVSFTATDNRRSWGLMERLGMRRDPAEDFDHPMVESGHRLERHVLYRLNRPA